MITEKTDITFRLNSLVTAGRFRTRAGNFYKSVQSGYHSTITLNSQMFRIITSLARRLCCLLSVYLSVY